MKFSIGDKIILKRTGEEGSVIGYLNDQMVEIEVAGISFPVYIEDIDHPYLKWFTEQNKKKPKKESLPEQLPVEKEKFRKPRLAKGIYLSFLPIFKTEQMEDIVDYFKIYLINELPIPIFFSYDVRLINKSEFKHEGTLHEFGHIYLHNISFENMSEQPRFHWELNAPKKDMEAAEGIVRIRPAKLFEHITDTLENNEPSFNYLLIEDLKPKQKPAKQEKFEQIPKPQTITVSSLPKHLANKDVIDLHIEQLIDNPKGLSNSEIMQLQLNELHKQLHLAIMNRQKHLTIIHGLGTGVLREAVHKALRKNPEVDHFINEWNGRYGFGATEVFFKH